MDESLSEHQRETKGYEAMKNYQQEKYQIYTFVLGVIIAYMNGRDDLLFGLCVVSYLLSQYHGRKKHPTPIVIEGNKTTDPNPIQIKR